MPTVDIVGWLNSIDLPTTVEFIEGTFRILSAVMISAAAGFILYRLIRGTLRPRAVWLYVGAIVTFAAIWRWMVLSSIVDMLGPWINPITALIYFLLGFSLMSLAVASSRKRRDDDDGR
jgi:apolipoprotein N-acyltransferase